MKYGKTWAAQVQSLPIVLQDLSISYKKWKQVSSNIPADILMQQLEKECNVVSKTFERHAKLLLNPDGNGCSCIFRMFCCNKTVDVATTAEDILLYATINKTTLYKICKRLDKRNADGGHAFIKWFNTKNTFVSSMYFTALTMQTKTDCECPVCLDPVSGDLLFIIFKCGHYVCYNCLLGLYGIRGYNGTLKDALAYNAENAKCPLCRVAHPCRKFMFFQSLYNKIAPTVIRDPGCE